jgi:hypothetical protein
MTRTSLLSMIAGMIVITAFFDYCSAAELTTPVLFLFPLALCVHRRSKTLLWCTAGLVILQSVAAGIWGFHRPAASDPWVAATNRGLVIDSLLGISILLHLWIDKSQKAVVEAAKIERHRLGLIEKNEQLETELARVKGFTHNKRKPLTLTIRQYQALAAQLSDLHRTMVVTAMCSDMRVAEVLALRWEQLDLENSLIFPQTGITQGGVAKSEPREDADPMDPVLREELIEWRHKTSAAGLVFPSHITGRCYHPGPIQQDYFRPAAQKLGLAGVCWHTFPHSYKTWLKEEGTTAVQQKLRRHAHSPSPITSKPALKVKAKPNGKIAPRAVTAADFQVGVSAGAP